MNGYPKIFMPILMTVTLTLFVTGLLLIPSFLMFRMEWDYDWVMDSGLASGDIRNLSTTLHAISGWIMVWIIGALWSLHMRSHWRRKENRTSGLVFSVYWAVLLATSLCIYYFGDEVYSQYSSIIHVLFGLGLPLTFLMHRHHGKQVLTRNKQASRV